MSPYRVLISGGYGFFGRRLVERLAAWPGLHLLVAGRSAVQAQALVDALGPRARASLEAIALDAQGADLHHRLRGLAPQVLVVRFGAGMELRFLHRGMNAMALLTRWGWVRDWSVHARWLKRCGDLFIGWGSDAGAMHVSVQGLASDGRTLERRWQLSATHGHGPYVPTLAAVALIRQLREGRPEWTGARPCVGVLTLADFQAECRGLQIHMGLD